jgi:hypothetical protein
MSISKINRVCAPLVLSVLVSVAVGGCGDGSVTTPPAIAPLDTDKLAAALPTGVTLQTPVRPDKLYGESAKTVEDALKSLLATVKGNTIYDALGHQIRFESPGKAPAKTAAKGQGTQVVVYLAN